MGQKVVKAETHLEFMENMEQTLEILTSEIPIDAPWRQKFEQTLKRLRTSIEEFRESIERPS
jgi:hypothetical protein